MFIEFLKVVFSSLFLMFGFLENNNSFPKPLTSEEENLYLIQMKEGDVEARNKLIEHNLRLVAHIAKKYACTYDDSEELLSIGTIGLIKGVMSFDDTKKTKLATYVARCIENAIVT